MDYSDLKKYLKIEGDKKLTNEHAYITHYLQNSKNGVASIYKKKALEYIASRIEKSVDTTWDVPFPPPKKPLFKFIDLFAGIGGFRLALQSLGGKSVFSSEIDNAAKQTYESNFGEYPFGDIRDFTGSEITDRELKKLIPNHDVLAGGFPCQPFSLAGVSARNYLDQEHGFLDKNQGNLFFDIARIIDLKKPKIVFLENVKNFERHDGGNTFTTVKKTMEDLGYHFFSKTINAKSLVPQKRERFYIVCFKKKLKYFEFPDLTGDAIPLRSILEDDVSPEYTISDRLWEGHINRTRRNIERGTGFIANLANLDEPSNTLVARYGKDGKECLIPQEGMNPRKLTPRECARLQGFPENYKLPPSNAAAYKQFGNSVAVPVVEKIASNFIKILLRSKK
ncbi:MAG: DNA cytosine methyltransferase [Allomuricauda sp.]